MTTDKVGHGLNEWANALRATDLSLADKLYEEQFFKNRSRELLDKMELPRFKEVMVSAKKFKDDAKKIALALGCDLYFMIIIDDNGKRIREKDLNFQEVMDLFSKNVDFSKINNYRILLSECFPKPYAGVLMMDSSERFLLEMVKGSLADLIEHNKTPDYRVIFDRQNNPSQVSIRYEQCGNEELSEYLKNKMYTIIQLSKFRRGNYEFCLAQKSPESDELTPLFFEYNDRDMASNF